ncbi:MAG TPA: winged helix-turn-helix domain-containing protein [Puia sp.]|nr:winged helix-turn-helix domain-containing protein [Puia sp.]
METEEQFGQIASLIGERARAKMLWHLLDGRAFTATELSLRASVSPQSASMHLNKLIQAGLLSVEHQGRHRYYQFSSRDVAYAIEAIASLLPRGKKEARELPPVNGHIKYCRSCYDHLAGKMGVALADGLVQRKLITPAGGQYAITPSGKKWFAALDIDIDELKAQRRNFARQCLDWSERRHHLAGSLGAALLEKMLGDDWLRKTKSSRVIIVTAFGEKKFYDLLGYSS